MAVAIARGMPERFIGIKSYGQQFSASVRIIITPRIRAIIKECFSHRIWKNRASPYSLRALSPDAHPHKRQHPQRGVLSDRAKLTFDRLFDG